jgi:hypothetical protein
VQRKVKKQVNLLKISLLQKNSENTCPTVSSAAVAEWSPLIIAASSSTVDAPVSSTAVAKSNSLILTASPPPENTDYSNTMKFPNTTDQLDIDDDVLNFVASNYSSSSSTSDIDTDETSLSSFNDNLRLWVSENNITCTAVNKLLNILRPQFKCLPRDYRGLLHTSRSIKNISNLSNGQMFHLGILNQLLIKMADGLKTNVTKILLQININGLPLFKSSNIELYPILGVCSDFINDTPFIISCFVGTGKPDPIETFLAPFLLEFKKLQLAGFDCNNKHFNIDIKFFICDAPARAYLKGIVGHTGKHGCEKCTIIGQYQNYRINFVQDKNYLPILDEDFITGNKPFIKTNVMIVGISSNKQTAWLY